MSNKPATFPLDLVEREVARIAAAAIRQRDEMILEFLTEQARMMLQDIVAEHDARPAAKARAPEAES